MYILIYTIILSGDFITTNHVEFKSLAACEKAEEMISNTRSKKAGLEIFSKCLPK